LVTEARSRIRRYTPAEVRADSELLIVDIRSADERERSGVIPGSKHVPFSTVLWRADQTSEWRDDDLAGRRLCLICQHGESSSLAAAALVHLGADAGDLIGGYEAW
jgi:rhodanese-related sulfurtransferase